MHGLLIYCAEWPSVPRKGEDLMSNERTDHRTALVLFGIAVMIAVLLAFVTTFERVNNRTASSEAAPGTTGLAKAHPPLDRAPGQPALGN